MLLFFVLAVDALAACIIKAYFHAMLRGFHMMRYPEGIPLLQFNDDTSFFIEESSEERNLYTP